jgi:F-type H+-transporting ATPase subunit b
MSDLGIKGWDLAIQLIAFLVFIYLLWRYAFGPITRMLDQRAERVREGVEAAQRMQQEMQATAARNEEVLAEARRQSQDILKQARDQGDAVLARATEEAGKKGDEFLARAQATLRAETEQARQQLRQELADLAVSAASRIVKKELDPATQTRLIEETLAEAGGTRSTGPVA